MKPFPSWLALVVLLGALVEAQCAWATHCHESVRNVAQSEHIAGGGALVHLTERSLCCGLVDSNSRRVEQAQQALGITDLSASFYQSINLPLADRPPIGSFASRFVYPLSAENYHA